MVQNVSNQQAQQPSRGKVFLNALAQTAMTAGVGAAGGASVGALASLVVPPKSGKILEQYQDAFLQATTGENSTTLRDLVSRTSPDTFEYAKGIAPKLMATDRALTIHSMSEDAFKELGKEQFEKLGLSGTSYTKESAIEELRSTVGSESKADIKETIEEMRKKAKETLDDFAAKAKESFEGLAKDNELYKLSRKSAKSFNRKNFLNKGIKIGIVVALLGSVILNFVASKRAQKQAQQQAAMEAAAQKQAENTQGENQMKPEQAQMMAQEQNAIPEINQQSAMSQIKPLAQNVQTPQMPMPQMQMQMPQIQGQEQNAPAQTAQNSAAQYFKTPMPSPLV